LAGAEAEFAPGRGLGVVDREHRAAQACAERLDDGEACGHGKDARVQRVPAPVGNDPCDRGADPIEPSSPSGGKTGHGFAPGIGAEVPLGDDLPLMEDRAVGDKRGENLRPADVDREHRLRHRRSPRRTSRQCARAG
jgi:hypothetical protein